MILGCDLRGLVRNYVHIVRKATCSRREICTLSALGIYLRRSSHVQFSRISETPERVFRTRGIKDVDYDPYAHPMFYSVYCVFKVYSYVLVLLKYVREPILFIDIYI